MQTLILGSRDVSVQNRQKSLHPHGICTVFVCGCVLEMHVSYFYARSDIEQLNFFFILAAERALFLENVTKAAKGANFQKLGLFLLTSHL